MINLSNVKFDTRDINPAWVYSYYLNIPLEQFNGGTIKVLSPFKEEKEPSFVIYLKGGKLKFKDFSSGLSGDCYNLVTSLLNIPFNMAVRDIVNSYNQWILKGGSTTSIELIEKPTYRVQCYEKRKWNVLDKNYWLSFHIGSKLLEWGCVHPLSFYTMTNEDISFTIKGDYIYGYFNKSGELIKIYKPNDPSNKFTNVQKYISGSEHSIGSNTLIIASSWKDALSIWNMGIKTDIHVHNSENNVFSESYIKDIHERYKYQLSLLDNDSTGIECMLKYKELYNIDYVYVPLKKDISDSVKYYGTKYVRNIIVPIIDKQINK